MNIRTVFIQQGINIFPANSIFIIDGTKESNELRSSVLFQTKNKRYPVQSK